MIFTIGSLKIPVKQAYGEAVMQCDLSKIEMLIDQDPEVSHMDLLVFTPKDVPVSKRKNFIKKLDSKHPDIIAVCFDVDKKSIYLSKPGVEVIPEKNLGKDNIKKHLEPFLQQITTRGERTRTNPSDERIGVESGDDLPFEELGLDDEEIAEVPNKGLRAGREFSGARHASGGNTISAKPEPLTVTPLEELNLSLDQDVSGLPTDNPQRYSTKDNSSEKYGMEEPSGGSSSGEDKKQFFSKEGSSSASDFSGMSETELRVKFDEGRKASLDDMVRAKKINPTALRDLLSHDNIASKLMHENNTFHGAMNMLDVLDGKIANIFKSATMEPTEKFRRIKELGMERAGQTDICNNHISETMITLINQILQVVDQITDERINNFEYTLKQLAAPESLYFNEEKVRRGIEIRLSASLEIRSTIDEIVEIYSIINESTADFIKQLMRDLPSRNVFINEMLKHVASCFIPPHMDVIINKLTYDVSRSAEIFHIIEKKLERLNKAMFEYAQASEKMIGEQSNLVELLKSNRVEQIVIPDQISKSAMRAFIGPSGIGRTSTTLMYSELQAKRRNTLVINFSGEVDFPTYGVSMASMNEFLRMKMYKQILYVNSDVGDDVELIKEQCRQLIPKLEHYHFINLVFDSSQYHLLEAIAPMLLSVTFLSNSTKHSIKSIERIVTNFKFPNVARRFALIDPPKNIAPCLELAGVDPTITKLMVIPHLAQMREYTLRGLNPIIDPDLCIIYTEAFGN